MFELANLTGTAERSIVLETRKRSRISNSQAPEPGAREIAIFSRLLSTHAGWERRKEPCGIYNCFGHVWASRRTAVYTQDGVETILRDDGYRPLRPSEQTRCGDLAYYRDHGGSEALHVGVVSELRALQNPAGGSIAAPVAWVLSKWNDISGEVLHHYNDVPWEPDTYRIVFMTDRT